MWWHNSHLVKFHVAHNTKCMTLAKFENFLKCVSTYDTLCIHPMLKLSLCSSRVYFKFDNRLGKKHKLYGTCYMNQLIKDKEIEKEECAMMVNTLSWFHHVSSFVFIPFIMLIWLKNHARHAHIKGFSNVEFEKFGEWVFLSWM